MAVPEGRRDDKADANGDAHEDEHDEIMRRYTAYTSSYGQGEKAHGPKRNIIEWLDLAGSKPPAFTWLLDHWLSWHPTLLAGRGGVGKSLLAQQVATALAIGRPLWGTSQGPVSVLYWACEDDKTELWRRQDRICKQLKIPFVNLDNLHIDARCGLENAIFTTVYGKPDWTPLWDELHQEVNDYHADVLILDNLSQTFGGNENDRHHVTTFLNGIIGIVKDRPFCPIVLGHISKSPSSEYSGSTAWENAARMRWYLADKLPDEADADPTESGTNSDTRFLCKRKTNYSTQDYVELGIENGLFIPRIPHDNDGIIGSMRNQRAKSVLLAAVRKLAGLGIYGSEVKGTSYLPSKIVEMKLNEGVAKPELKAAMNALLMSGELIKEQVGKYAKGAPRFGLVTAELSTAPKA